MLSVRPFTLRRAQGERAESKEVFEDFLAPIYRYVCETPNRVPIADIYLADSGRRRANQARSVVGGFFMKLLADQLARARLNPTRF